MSRVGVLLACLLANYTVSGSFWLFNNMATKDDCKCKPKVAPVCVREGPYQYSYMNECIFKCASRKRKDLSILYKGSCCSAKECGMFESPVCSEDGQMYRTICDFEERQCIEHRQANRHVVMDSSHEKCSCILPCPPDWRPVCDTRGRTFANFCTFLNAKCYHKQHLNETIEVDYTGTCCEDMCNAGTSALTVCDSDGSTHVDLCSYYIKQCRQKRRGSSNRLRIVGIGSCKPKNPLYRTFDYFVSRFPNYHSPI